MKGPALVLVVIFSTGCASMGHVGTCTPSAGGGNNGIHNYRPDSEFKTINSNHGPIYIYRQGNTYWVNDRRTQR